jgi:hypothetical protein
MLSNAMKIFDCFLFNNELDILELRLRELHKHVDLFVIVEATRTHKNLPRQLVFKNNAERFKPWLAKIRYVVVDDMPDGDDDWKRENYHRNAIQRGIADAAPKDWIVISDVDEIPRPSSLAALKTSRLSVVGFRMSLSYFRINYIATGAESSIVWTVAYRRETGLTPQVARDIRFALLSGMPPKYQKVTGTFENAGWHFSYMGDEEAIRNKILAVLQHGQLPIEEVARTFVLDRYLQEGLDLYNRPGYRWEVVPLTSFFPSTVVRYPEKYKHLIAAPTKNSPTER